jgi:cobalt-zinc-cadmium efflux system protein
MSGGQEQGDHGHGGHGHDGHAHGRGGGPHAGRGHSHDLRRVRDTRLLAVSLALVLATMVAEIVAGAIADSLALLADAGHLLTDAVALGLAVFASWIAAKPPRGRYTFGFKRAEILAAQANGLVLVGLAVWILVEGVRRLVDPPDVKAELVGWVALAGVLVSIAISALLARAQGESLNVRAAYLHVVLDVVAFAATGAAAALIVLTGWDRFDPIASMFVAVLLARGGYGLLKETTQIFLEGAPSSALPEDVGRSIAAHPGVVETHDLHVWTVTSGFPALSAHVLVEPRADCHRIRLELEAMLRDRYGLDHTTLQVEHVGAASGLEIRRGGRQ